MGVAGTIAQGVMLSMSCAPFYGRFLESQCTQHRPKHPNPFVSLERLMSQHAVVTDRNPSTGGNPIEMTQDNTKELLLKIIGA